MLVLHLHWHAHRYKTRLCSFGNSCNRSICFFAHTTEELRCVPNMDDGKEIDEREFLMQIMVRERERGNRIIMCMSLVIRLSVGNLHLQE